MMISAHDLEALYGSIPAISSSSVTINPLLIFIDLIARNKIEVRGPGYARITSKIFRVPIELDRKVDLDIYMM